MKIISVKKQLEAIKAKKDAPKPKPVIRVLSAVESANIDKKSIEHKSIEAIPQAPNVQPTQESEDIITSLQDEMKSMLTQRAKHSSAIYRAVYGRHSDICIDIGSVLKKIDYLYDELTNEVRTFGVRFLTDGGKTSEMINCRKNVKFPKQKTRGQHQPRGKFKYNLKKRGTILLTGDGKQYRSVLVSTIYEFQDFKSKRWLRVRH